MSKYLKASYGFRCTHALVLMLIVLALLRVVAWASAGEKPAGWLLSAESDEKRFALIQTQLRGFDQPMWEVGERYRQLHDALSRDNYELAAYHWSKIGTSIRNGIAKRPARAQNAQRIFLDPHFDDVLRVLESSSQETAWQGFLRAKAACQSCHVAENVGYMNRQALFDLAPPRS